MLSKAKPLLITAAVVLVVLGLVKALAPESVKALVRV
jgi:hypothetical protein